MNKKDIIKKIAKIRVKNSSNTMDILRLAFKHSQKEASKLVDIISNNDNKVADLFKELIASPRDYNLVLDDVKYFREKNNQPWMELYALAYLGSEDEYESLRINEKRYNEEILELNKKVMKLVYCFDIDGTICSTNCDYRESNPYVEVINHINNLYDEGHEIKLYTSRGTVSGKNWQKFTEEQLSEWNIKYHELIFGKPHYDIFVDDRAHNNEYWYKKNNLKKEKT